jgi:hypothetical protein
MLLLSLLLLLGGICYSCCYSYNINIFIINIVIPTIPIISVIIIIIIIVVITITVLASANPGDKTNCSFFATPKQPWWRLKTLFTTPVATPEKELNTKPLINTN